MTIQWVSQRAASDSLGVSESTLQRWRNKHNILKLGQHYRYKSPVSKALLYNLEACEETINPLCSQPVEV
jgi:transposase